MENELDKYEWDTEVAPHAPDLYDFAGIDAGLNGFDAIDDQAIALYQQQGYLAIQNAFTPAEMQDAIDGLTDLVAGKRPDFHVIQYRAEVRDQLATMTTAEKFNHIRKLGTFTEYDARLKAIAQHPRLISLLHRILGAAPHMFQSMALIKPPRGREKPWHQDHAYFTLPIDAPVAGVWIALEQATAENGCMRVLPGWHKRGPFTHFQIRDWQLCDDESRVFKNECRAVPLDPGGMLIFDSYLPHGTPANDTPRGRKALQYHYVAADTPAITHDERLAVFGPDGRDARC
ncbi:MAG: phytanoyl-CoA dioxygenase family protein [Blastocatellia bacterium]